MDFCKLTEAIWKAYYVSEDHDDMDFPSLLAPDCVIIGSGKHEYYESRDEFLGELARELEENKEIPFKIKELWCRQRELDASNVMVYGEVHIWWMNSDDTTKIDMDFRFTLHYHLYGTEWKVSSIHHSLPNLEQGDGEYYPKTLVYQIEKSRELISALTELAKKDGLTGLINYRTFQNAYDLWDMKDSWIFIMDLDDFKQVNDTYGHMAGNDVLRGVADILRNEVHPQDIVCRMGGDEFIVLCGRMGDEKNARDFMERIRQAMAAAAENEKIWTTISIGATKLIEGDAYEEALERADQAMYAAKRAGKGMYDIA